MNLDPIQPEPMFGTGPEAGPRLYSLSELVSLIEDDAEMRHSAMKEGRLLGPVSGLASLDEKLGGFLRSGLHVIHGDPGSGKTALVIQACASCGFPSILVSAEMPVLELAKRVVSRKTRTFLSKLSNGAMTRSEASELAKKAFADCKGFYILDCSGGPASPTFIEESARSAMEKESVNTVLIALDSVHSWSAMLRPEDATEYETLSYALSQLRGLTKRLNCPMLATAERNRSSRKNPGMDASAGTRSFEYSAESVISLERQDDRADDPHEVKVNAVVQKNRHGSSNVTVRLLFHGGFQQFRCER